MRCLIFALTILSLAVFAGTSKAQLPEKVLFQPGTFGFGGSQYHSQPYPNQIMLKPAYQQPQFLNPTVTPYGSYVLVGRFGKVRPMPNSYRVRSVPPSYSGSETGNFEGGFAAKGHNAFEYSAPIFESGQIIVDESTGIKQGNPSKPVKAITPTTPITPPLPAKVNVRDLPKNNTKPVEILSGIEKPTIDPKPAEIKSVIPAPVISTPIAPKPVTPEPVVPPVVDPFDQEPAVETPIAPKPVTPEPVVPPVVDPFDQEPAVETPIAPKPVTPEPVAPPVVDPFDQEPAVETPIAPTPVTPEPVVPPVVDPFDQEPAVETPIAPKPVTPEPVVPPVVDPFDQEPAVETPIAPKPVIDPFGGAEDIEPSPPAGEPVIDPFEGEDVEPTIPPTTEKDTTDKTPEISGDSAIEPKTIDDSESIFDDSAPAADETKGVPAPPVDKPESTDDIFE